MRLLCAGGRVDDALCVAFPDPPRRLLSADSDLSADSAPPAAQRPSKDGWASVPEQALAPGGSA